jgi:hypothetical protein
MTKGGKRSLWKRALWKTNVPATNTDNGFLKVSLKQNKFPKFLISSVSEINAHWATSHL